MNVAICNIYLSIYLWRIFTEVWAIAKLHNCPCLFSIFLLISAVLWFGRSKFFLWLSFYPVSSLGFPEGFAYYWYYNMFDAFFSSLATYCYYRVFHFCLLLFKDLLERQSQKIGELLFFFYFLEVRIIFSNIYFKGEFCKHLKTIYNSTIIQYCHFNLHS